MKRALVIVALCAAACDIPDQSPWMQAGNDCMQCHGVTAQPWTAAGTLYAAPDASADAGVEGAKIYLQDADGKTFTLTTNGAGNFYIAEQLKFPLHAEAELGGKRMAMSAPLTSGACNSCHAQPAQNNAPGRLFVPPATAPAQ